MKLQEIAQASYEDHAIQTVGKVIGNHEWVGAAAPYRIYAAELSSAERKPVRWI